MVYACLPALLPIIYAARPVGAISLNSRFCPSRIFINSVTRVVLPVPAAPLSAAVVRLSSEGYHYLSDCKSNDYLSIDEIKTIIYFRGDIS